MRAAARAVGGGPGYLTRQLVTYIGNKRALLGLIRSAVEDVRRRTGQDKLRILDAFSGSGVVSRMLKQYASELVVNDTEDYARVISECYLANRGSTPTDVLAATVGALNGAVDAGSPSPGLIRRLYAPRDAAAIGPEDRVFYTPENADRLDTYRAPTDLDRGERLLLDVGLLVEREGKLIPTPQLVQLLDGSAADALATLIQQVLSLTRPAELEAPDVAAQLAHLVPDAARREQLLVALAQRFDNTYQRLVGEIGEELVMNAARNELRDMGRLDLAREVRRVSMLSDQLGYDISAPRVAGAPRLLEVKATTSDATSRSLAIHLSRNEADTGTTFPDWALVGCRVENIDLRLGHIVGWCREHALADLLPVDGIASRWDQASIEIPLERLSPGLPGVVG